MSSKDKHIRYWQAQADHAEADAHALRREVDALKRGVETKYEVTTITRTGTRNTRGFGPNKVDALHWAADQRIGGIFERVTISEIESRHRALYPDGRSINGFGH